ncbi:hypothetical protein WJX77_007193 [Trebouxia sp. C0004]
MEITRDARGHVLREADTPLKFLISGSNDVVLVLRQYVSELELGAFMGIEMKRGPTAKGLRQAEVGGAAFYQTGSSPAGLLLRVLAEG